MDYGHFKVSRKVFLPPHEGGDPFWNEPRVFSRWEAWMFLFGQAARYTETEWTLKSGKVIQLARGETPPLSVRYLMRVWGWGSKKRVSAFLERVQQKRRIRVQQRTADGDTYLVVNYEFYQDKGYGSGYSIGYSNGDGEGDKKEESIQKVVIPSDSYESSGIVERDRSTDGEAGSNGGAPKGTKRKPSGRWMWDLWLEEFGGDFGNLQYTDKRREKFGMLFREHLEKLPPEERRDAFREMLQNIRNHEWWHDKPQMWLPERCLLNAERREEVATGYRSRSRPGAPALDIHLPEEFFE